MDPIIWIVLIAVAVLVAVSVVVYQRRSGSGSAGAQEFRRDHQVSIDNTFPRDARREMGP